MASSEQQSSSFLERLISSRNRDISLFLPFVLGLNSTNPFQEAENHESPDGIILINQITQGMVVIERRGGRSRSDDRGSSVDFDSFVNDLFNGKGGRPPASKASIDALETVEMVGGEQCVICLEEWEHGQKAKKIPCGHSFHGECIEKWLRIHGSCPVCRYEMPEEEDKDASRSGEGEGERRRGIWMSFVFSRGRRSGEGDQEDFEEGRQEMQG